MADTVTHIMSDETGQEVVEALSGISDSLGSQEGEEFDYVSAQIDDAMGVVLDARY